MKFELKNITFILFLVLLVAAFFRFYNLNWDNGSNLHPDERAIILFTLPLEAPKSINEFLTPQSPLNPHFFAYGNFPLYLLKAASDTAGIINPHLMDYDGIQIVGRIISVLADLLTIFLIFRIGKILFDNKSGIIGASLYAVSVFPIQASHFYAVDILLTLFIVLTIYRLLKLYQKPSLINAVIVGIAFGLALTTKISAFPLIIAITCALIADFIFIFIKSPHKPRHWFPHIPALLKKLITEGLVIGFFTIITFVIIQPYAIIDSAEFIKQTIQQSQMTRDAYTFPYTLQYVGKIPYFYELKNIFLWGLGPVISLLCLSGIVFFLIKIKTIGQNKKSEILIIITFSFVYFLIVGSFSIGFMRYMLPLYPFLCLFGGLFITGFIMKFAHKIKNNLYRSTFYLILILLVILWPISFMSIYNSSNTRITASNWINKNIPLGSGLTHEIWDDQLPLYTAGNYETIPLGLYDQPDDETKWSALNQKINTADYIIISSNRLYTPIQNLSDCTKYKICFPIASKFYKNLLSEKGYTKVAEFTSFPTVPFLNIKIDDTSADESFTVYDHPKVLIFKKDR